MSYVILILELVGTIAFSISGAITAVKKRMDLFGVAILSLTTAVGGGIIRDVLLGCTPPATFRDPIYAVISFVVAAAVFLPFLRNAVYKSHVLLEKILLVMDSVGLGIFTVIGIESAHNVIENPSAFLAVFVGVVTGVGGGVMRDIFAGQAPYIFVKHFYATASLIGAIICEILYTSTGKIISIIVGAVIVVILRLAAAQQGWNLPKIEND